MPAYNGANVHKFRSRCRKFHFIILHAKAKKHLPWHSALSRPTVRIRVGLSVDSSTIGRLYVPGHQPTQSVAAFIVFLTGQHVIEINARATAVALRPTAVSEGRPVNRRVVQWQRRRRRLTGQNEFLVLTTLILIQVCYWLNYLLHNKLLTCLLLMSD